MNVMLLVAVYGVFIGFGFKVGWSIATFLEELIGDTAYSYFKQKTKKVQEKKL